MGKHADEFDAEAMIEEIRSLSESSQDSVSDEFRASLGEEQSIQSNLRKMNQSWMAGHGTGWTRICIGELYMGEYYRQISLARPVQAVRMRICLN